MFVFFAVKLLFVIMRCAERKGTSMMLEHGSKDKIVLEEKK